MINERINNLNPYQELLNSPDPARSLAAMQIMMESGDADLVRMATEYGLLSPNPTVKRIALEGFLATKPVLSIRFDGSKTSDKDFSNVVVRNWTGTVDADMVGYWRISVGEYLADSSCYANTYNTSDCFITVNSDGVFLTPRYMNGRATISPEGSLIGTANLSNVTDTVPFTIQLID